MNENCLFCKIAKGEIDSVKVYEDENTLAFLDISPVEKGHTLVISKRLHSEALIETPADVLAELLATAKRVGQAMLQAGFGGFNIVQNNYPDGGQAVPHIHLHVIPRAKGRKRPLEWRSGANPYSDDAERVSIASTLAGFCCKQ
mgnify:CR=1 FL=1